MFRPVKPKDLLAPALVWALALTGCIVGEVKSSPTTLTAVCPPAAH